jgi:hypothetical protein
VTIRRRNLQVLVLLSAIFVASAYFLYKPTGTQPIREDLPSITSLVQTDTRSLGWSGEHEGELVEVTAPETGSGFRPPYPPFARYSFAAGIDEGTKRFGKSPLLPALLPKATRYADVYVGPVVMISYSYEKARDFRDSAINIQVTVGPRQVPTREEEEQALNSDLTSGERLIDVGNTWIATFEKAQGDNIGETVRLAFFFHGGLYYIVRAEPNLAMQDFIGVLESMLAPQ